MRQKVVLLGAFVVVALVAIPAGLASAPAISFTVPSPAEGATVALNSSVQFAFTYNRTTKQTRSLNCALSGPNAYLSSAACPTSTASYGSLAPGSYTFSVTLTLTDGGRASATRHFTVSGGADISLSSTGTTFPIVTVHNAGPLSAAVALILVPNAGSEVDLSFDLGDWVQSSTAAGVFLTSTSPIPSGGSLTFQVGIPTGGHIEVYSSSQPDPDSTPNNGDATEDDYVLVGSQA